MSIRQMTLLFLFLGSKDVDYDVCVHSACILTLNEQFYGTIQLKNVMYMYIVGLMNTGGHLNNFGDHCFLLMNY